MRNLPRPSRVGWTSVSTAVLGALIWFGCADSPQAPVPPDAELSRSAQATSRLQELDLTPALEAQERHGAALMRIKGVVGHGVGVDEDGNPTITVYTLTSGVSGIPARLDDVPTRTVVSGQFVAGALTARLRPAPNGYSIGHPDITAGTLGAVVQDGGDVCYVLSNNHVLANSNDANIGDSALQPGPFDGGSDPDDAIGTLADFEPINFDGSANRIDAAIAEIFTPVDGFVTAATPNYAPGSTVRAASVGLDVKKVGRTTELSSGEVTEIDATINVCYACSGPFCFNCTKLATFDGQIVTTDMSEGGDSGSLLVTDDNNANPVGLLFAGSSTRTIHNPIGDVMTRFGTEVIQPDDLGSCTNGGDVDSPPSVSITNPADGATVSGNNVSITADASDDNAVTQVEFFVDANSVGIDSDGSDGWSTTWDSETVGDGSHTITAEATDDASQTASDQITVTVDNVDSPPSVAITNPTDGSTVSGTVSITADASDDGTVTQVEFLIDGAPHATDTDGSDGWSTTWDTSGETDGSFHTIEAEATDDASQTASDQISVTVDNSAPSSMHVGDLSSNSINQGSTWDAVVTIMIVDSGGNPVEGASVSGDWSGAGTGSGNCSSTTDGNGQCTVTRTGIHKSNSSVTYTVTNVTNGLTYDDTANVETSITVSKP